MYKTTKGLASVSLVRRMGKGSYNLAALVKNMVISDLHLMKKDEYLKEGYFKALTILNNISEVLLMACRLCFC